MQAVASTIRDGLNPGQIGGVIARAGVGKSTFLVHVALNSLVRGVEVLHVSLTDTKSHVRSYYDEIFNEIARHTSLPDPTSARLAIERHRVVHTCLGRQFGPMDLSRLLDVLKEMMDFSPEVVVLDGLKTEDLNETGWKRVAEQRSLRLWMSILIHRDGGPTPDALSEGLSTAIHLKPEGRDVALQVIRVADAPGPSQQSLHLDPATMMVRPEEVTDPSTTAPSPSARHCTLYSGGAQGSESYFGQVANSWGLKEVNFTFEGHTQARSDHKRVLSEQELAAGAVSLVYVSHRLHRHWDQTPTLRKVLQVLWHIVSHADQVFVVGVIQSDQTVHGGTGWSVELARRWHKPIWVFDQEKDSWFIWDGSAWRPGMPVIESTKIAGSGTRFLSENGKKAIEDLFARSFTSP